MHVNWDVVTLNSMVSTIKFIVLTTRLHKVCDATCGDTVAVLLLCIKENTSEAYLM